MRALRAEIVMLSIIVCLAAWLRLGWIGVNSFGFDEARVSDMALQMVREGQFAALGMQSSTGVPNFPALIWLIGLPYFFSTNPLVATWFIGLLNLIALAGIWWLARAAWGSAAGLVTALLFATSPYLVFYSRNIWSQNLLAPLAIFWAVAAMEGIRKADGRWLGLFMFLTGFTAQVHIAGVILVPVSLWIIIRYTLWRRWRVLFIGGGLAVLTALPTVYTIWRFGSGAQAELQNLLAQPSALDWGGFRELANLALNLDWEWFWLNAEWSWPVALNGLLVLGNVVLGLFLLLGVGGNILSVVSHRWGTTAEKETRMPEARQILGTFLLIWAVAAPLFFLRGKTFALIHYQLASLPALLLLMGAATAVIPWKGWPWLVCGLVVIVAGAQTMALAITLTTVDSRLVPGGMGTPLSYPQAAARTLQATGKPVVVESFGDVPAYDGDAAVFKVLFWDYPARVVDGRSALLIPDGPANLLFTYENLTAWEVLTQIGLAGERIEFPRRENELPYVGYRLETVDVSTWLPAPAAQLANGAVLQGWQLLPTGDDRLRLITYWRIGENPVDGHFQQFNHLYTLDSDGPQQVQDQYTSSRSWQLGDHLFTWANFDRPEAPIAYFHIGMYTWPDLQRSRVSGQDDPLQPVQLDMPE
jgi:4-amino-4-deoxy-L-arabinose transferase-like glycosyltransferase